MKRIAINGLGCFRRMVLQHYMDVLLKEVELVAANGLVPVDDLAYLIKYDSVQRRMPFLIAADKNAIYVGT
jgi:glyceraldehyde 3-phosphate dehydrogenase